MELIAKVDPSVVRKRTVVGEERSRSFLFWTSTSKLKALRKSAPMIGRDTSAKTKVQEHLRPFMLMRTRLEPYVAIFVPFAAVKKTFPGGEGEGGGVTLISAPVSMRYLIPSFIKQKTFPCWGAARPAWGVSFPGC